jgi:hypothetical protein
VRTVISCSPAGPSGACCPLSWSTSGKATAPHGTVHAAVSRSSAAYPEDGDSRGPGARSTRRRRTRRAVRGSPLVLLSRGVGGKRGCHQSRRPTAAGEAQ